MNEPIKTPRLDAVVRWLVGSMYVFKHENGAIHAVRARSEQGAKRKMRAFLQRAMFGDWAMTYDPVAVDREFEKYKLV